MECNPEEFIRLVTRKFIHYQRLVAFSCHLFLITPTYEWIVWFEITSLDILTWQLPLGLAHTANDKYIFMLLVTHKYQSGSPNHLEDTRSIFGLKYREREKERDKYFSCFYNHVASMKFSCIQDTDILENKGKSQAKSPTATSLQRLIA